jgi:hypothetical protein
MINVYVDMDGVVADFDEWIRDYYPELENKPRFKKAVTEESVFENLGDQEGALILMDAIEELATAKDISVNFLTSVGTADPELGTIVAAQKQKWLDDRKYLFKPLFVTEKRHKAKYAHSKAILIDDRPGCVDPFRQAGGRAILHKDPQITIEALKEHINIIKKEI